MRSEHLAHSKMPTEICEEIRIPMLTYIIQFSLLAVQCVHRTTRVSSSAMITHCVCG